MAQGGYNQDMTDSVQTTPEWIEIGGAVPDDPATGNLRIGSAELRHLIFHALAEDIGSGDITSALLPADMPIACHLLAKAGGVVAGLVVAEMVFHKVDPAIVVERLVPDGSPVTPGMRLATVRGNARAVLTAERTALNFLQRMSGIATATSRFVQAVAGTNARILDTRKTAPALRLLDKWAVRLGGGINHRIGLYDMVLIKDNHIAAAGGVTAAVRQAREIVGNRPIPIEVEVTTLDQLDEALQLPVQRIMLDNMSLEQMRTAVQRTAGRIKLEASGNVRLDTVATIAATGVDYISSGALTHSVRALDISLECDGC
jgi:nicotinate-nucleotide pyrophosphorylase (carboxylating)